MYQGKTIRVSEIGQGLLELWLQIFGIVDSPAELDLALILGLGLPRYLGGRPWPRVADCTTPVELPGWASLINSDDVAGCVDNA